MIETQRMNDTAHRQELGEFLRARRAEVSPETVGLRQAGIRRVPGLRREEIAQLASISPDYYTRLEQGRMPASAAVLEALASILHLNDDQRTYMFELAGRQTSAQSAPAVQKARPELLRLLNQLTEIPAMIQGRYFYILAWNAMAAALLVDFSEIPEHERNYVRLLFMHPTMRSLYDDWESVARFAVTLLRMEAADNPDDPRLLGLVNELSTRNQQFRTWWDAHDVSSKSSGTRVFSHARAGVLSLEWDILVSRKDQSQELVVWTAQPGTAAHEGLKRLNALCKPN